MTPPVILVDMLEACTTPEAGTFRQRTITAMATTESADTRHDYRADKVVLIKRLHRIQGQLRGIEKMIEDDRHCIDVLTQVAAANTALENLAFRILDQHVTACVADAVGSDDQAEAREKTRELLEAVQRFAKTR